jgi:PPM family protein phosphatase
LAAADARWRPLVCSDGLTNEVDDRSTAAVLRALSDPQSAADELISAAMRAGGRDDATALVIDVVAIRAGSVSDPDGTPSLTALHAGD